MMEDQSILGSEARSASESGSAVVPPVITANGGVAGMAVTGG